MLFFVTQGASRILASLAMLGMVECCTPAAAAEHAEQLPIETATLGDAAFAAAVGLVRVNVAAGVGNAQSNVVDLRVHRASDGLMASQATQVRVHCCIAGPSGRTSVVVVPGALAGASGVIQVNQTAGDGNVSANAFTLRVHP